MTLLRQDGAFRCFPGQPRNCAILAARTMPRMARVVAEAVPHHITQRGNNRQDTFFLPDDRSFYLETLRAKCRDHGVPAYWVIA